MGVYNYRVNERIIQKLLHINQEFYQRFGEAFAETRRRIQPGVGRVLAEIVHDGDWLDLGCGSGALITQWIAKNLRGSYTGLDFSDALLNEARKNLSVQPEHEGLEIRYLKADLLQTNWALNVNTCRYDGVMAFACLHHLPGSENRVRVIRDSLELLKPDGVFIHSEWQFQYSGKMMSRVLPWSTVGIDEEDLEDGDTLLDWRHAAAGQGEARGLRYVHLFSRQELMEIADAVGARIVNEFASDGKGGNLALYQVWKRK
jgi:2-polyprenyl-3-methyl-5-hydroxy-6-metoxy-1,4-benzoquinol methylase